jgi:WhiB family redox-sensing transcriptional regulator
MAAYSHGCHCPACQGANAQRAARYRLGHPLVDRPHQLALSHVPLYGPWQANAACRGEPTAVFFPDRPGDTGLALEICAACPVIVECRAYGLAHPGLQGVFGGTTEAERRVVRRQDREAS